MNGYINDASSHSVVTSRWNSSTHFTGGYVTCCCDLSYPIQMKQQDICIIDWQKGRKAL
jgi:hypothetical protein